MTVRWTPEDDERIEQLKAANPSLGLPIPSSYVGELKGMRTVRFSGFYDDATTPFYRPTTDPVRIRVMLPRSRWQAFKSEHRDAWWMRGLVRLAPVKYKQRTSFMGKIEVNDQTVTVTSLDTRNT